MGNAAYGGGPMQGQGYPHPAGSTALALYALLKCQVSPRDPIVRKGFEFLAERHEKPGGSYETSMMLLAACATGNPYKTTSGVREARGAAEADRARSAAGRRPSTSTCSPRRPAPPGATRWPGQRRSRGASRTCRAPSSRRSPSSRPTRRRSGPRTAVWEDILQFSLAQQDTDGQEVVTKDPVTGQEIRRKARGFAYIKGQPHPEEGQATGSMTACGIANIMMARYVLTDAGRKRAEWDLRPDAGEGPAGGRGRPGLAGGELEPVRQPPQERR